MKKINIQLSPGCLLFLCAYGIFDPYHSFWCFFISVILHECGHIAALLLMDKKMTGISGTSSGIEIQTVPLSYKEELLVASAGPAVNLFLIAICIHRYPIGALINGILLWYNLLPMVPFDGGRIIRSCLRSCLPLSLCDSIEQIIGICSFSLLFAGALIMTFRLHSGMWPIVFCSFLFYRVGDIIFPSYKQIPSFPKFPLDKSILP